MKGLYNLKEKFKQYPAESLFISEITLAELYFGIACSLNKEKNTEKLNNFLTGVQLLPISQTLVVFANEKARLKATGNIIEDFDLLIGAAALYYNFTVVTNNVEHLGRLENIKIEDWTK
jgi:tRNA(fMet)-specific endonuclease VapC